MKTTKSVTTVLAALLLSGGATVLLGQATAPAPTCPSGQQAGYRGAGKGRGAGAGAGAGMGQCQRRGVCDGTGAMGTAANCPLGQAGQVEGTITSADADNILFMKQEEKLARDVYQVLAAQWEHPTFVNIARSEQRHMDAVDRLIAGFGLTDTTPAEPGQFSIPELQALYTELVAKGGASLAEALAVGVLIEETDIEDLGAVLAATQNPTVTRVMTNLGQASINHLAAFNAALENPEAPTCTGMGMGKANGKGKASGNRGNGQGNTPAKRGGGRQ